MVSPCGVTRESVMSGMREPMLMVAGLLSAVTICGRERTSSRPSVRRARRRKLKSVPETEVE